MIASEVWPILWLTLRISGAAVLAGSAIGLPLGAWLGLSRARRRTLTTALVYTGMALPPVVVGLGLYLLLSRGGPLGFLGWLFTPTAIILAQTILVLPFVVAITMNAVAAVPDELALQVRGLGATPFQARLAVLREARPGVLLAVVAALGRSLSEVGAVLIVGGNIAGQTRVLTTAVVLETSRGRFPLALTLGAILLLLALAVNLALLGLHRGRAVT